MDANANLVERNITIATRVLNGEPLYLVGADFDISRERARQITVKVCKYANWEAMGPRPYGVRYLRENKDNFLPLAERAHGGGCKMSRYEKEINKLIPKAEKIADRVIEPLPEEEKTSTLWSNIFHRAMNTLARDAGLRATGPYLTKEEVK